MQSEEFRFDGVEAVLLGFSAESDERFIRRIGPVIYTPDAIGNVIGFEQRKSSKNADVYVLGIVFLMVFLTVSAVFVSHRCPLR
jgi:hypothetical protein